MTKRYWSIISVAVLLALLVGIWQPVLAKESLGDPAAERVAYEWYLLRWSDHEVVCTLLISHDSLPTNEEIRTRCMDDVYGLWRSTPGCEEASLGGDTTECAGLYLVFNDVLSWTPADTEPLNSVNFEVSLLGCVPDAPDNWCAKKPSLIVTTEGGIAFTRIVKIKYRIGDETFVCSEAFCEISLPLTDKRGELIKFWGVDHAGRKGRVHQLRYRLLDTKKHKIVTEKDEEGFVIDIVGSALQGNDENCCYDVWSSFRSVELPKWLITPANANKLKTNRRYYYLAGRLIENRISSPRACPNGGLRKNGYATECGLNKALEDVITWQNQYDALIFQTANETGVPARLLKNLFARESQMWPADYQGYEFGLGHITEHGADTLLMWNYEFFLKFCTLQFGFSSECQNSYTRLTLKERRILKGLVLNLSSAYCADCDYSVEETAVPFAIELFAETLKANAYQTGQIVRNITGKEPGEVVSYPVLWRFTLVNYNAGPGCLGDAVEKVVDLGQRLTWKNLKGSLEGDCRGSIDYVGDIIAGKFSNKP